MGACVCCILPCRSHTSPRRARSRFSFRGRNLDCTRPGWSTCVPKLSAWHVHSTTNALIFATITTFCVFKLSVMCVAMGPEAEALGKEWHEILRGCLKISGIALLLSAESELTTRRQTAHHYGEAAAVPCAMRWKGGRGRVSGEAGAITWSEDTGEEFCLVPHWTNSSSDTPTVQRTTNADL
ncbi:hypothetical protein EI94DRAFT_1744665 [Lactarius quietus]|nr:hypothetical protein EI94DRAFT_1744665 [Lactarius quietus]